MNETFEEYMNQASVLMSVGKYDEALKYLSKAEVEDNRNVEVYIKEGICLVNKNELNDAEKTIKKALYVDKNCGEAYYHLACIAGLNEDLQQAIQYTDMAKINGYDNAQLYFTQGMLYEEQNDTNMAIRNYNKALQLEPTRADIHLQKCNLLLGNERQEDAIDAATEMIKNCPDYFEGYHIKCRILTEFEKYSEAIDVLEEGLRMFPEEEGFKLDKARIMVFQNKLEEAENLLKELENNKNEWYRSVLLEEARVYGLQNNYAKTKDVLEKAYKECRDGERIDSEIAYLLMSTYMSEKTYDLVLPVAEELIKLEENGTYINIAQFYKAEALNNIGKKDEAKKEYELTIKRCRANTLANPAAIDAYMMRGLSHNRLGENERAIELIDYVISLAPESAEAHSARAVVLKDMGEEDELKKEIEIINKIGGQLSQIVSNN